VLRELFVSVVSGIVVAFVLDLFKRGRDRDRLHSQAIRHDPPPRRGSFLPGGLTRLSLAVAGGIALAYSIAPLLLGRRLGQFGGYGRFDRYDGYGSLASHLPMIVLTVLGTVVVWALLSVLTRR
jgi:hypothetical protein